MPAAPAGAIRKTGQVTVTCLTPLALPVLAGKVIVPLAGDEVPGLPGAKIVSACVGRPLRLGGWDSLEQRPLPLAPFLPAGSTWFCVVETQAIEGVLNLHGAKIGARQAYGFGQIALGTWEEKGAT